MTTAPTTANGRTVYERILLYGAPGSGKTHAALSMAKWATKDGGKILVMDSDFAYDRMLTDDHFSDIDNIEIFDTETWDEWKDGAKKVKELAEPEDWVIVDLANHAWETAQDEFVKNAFTDDLSDYWQTQRAAGNLDDGTPLDGWKDWQVINRMYRSVMTPTVHKMRAHVIACTPEEGLRKESRSGKGGESSKTKELFGRLGAKPRGQKDLPHLFHTVLRMEETRTAGWVFSTAKDRAREKQVQASAKAMHAAYLVKVGGWRP